uniref:Protein inturned n=1 Tax=Clastoptera arizonana TaxID=38151 RepID=A0A1B6CYB8_9HEMI
MSDNEENQALLIQELLSNTEGIRQQSSHRDHVVQSWHSERWWGGSDSSCSSSYCCESHSGSLADWESEINSQGELFYIESLLQTKVSQNIKSEKDDDRVSVEGTSDKNKKVLNKKTTKGKLVRLMRRRNSRRSFRKKSVETVKEKLSEASEISNKAAGSKVTFRDSQEGEMREVKLTIDPEDIHNLGRRATPCEALLGIVTSTFSDQSRIMIAGFIPNGQAAKHRNVKIGDWLRSINNEEVNIQNIDSYLLDITTATEVTLILQRVAGCDVTLMNSSEHNPGIEQSQFVRQIVEGMLGSKIFEDVAVGVLYLTKEDTGEEDHPDQGVLYRFPSPTQSNALYSIKGAFLTLHQLVPDLALSAPISTSINYKGQLSHVIYTSEGNDLLLIAFPDERCCLKAAVQLNTDITRKLKFMYQTLSRCFSCKGNKLALDKFFSLFFSTLDSNSASRFEDVLPAVHWIPLPMDTQVQIDDSLSELESNDFGGYSEDHHEYQRMYSIIGSCLFYKGYLLSSHLNGEDLKDITAYCKHLQLLELTRKEPIKSIVIWKEVFPASCNRGLPSNSTTYLLPQGRWFLLIIGQGQEMLAVLLESGGCTVKVEGNPGPDILYVEQAQATLQHIKEIGALAIAEKWILLNPRPQVISIDSQNKIYSKQANESSLLTSRSSENSPLTQRSPNSSHKKSLEVTSILKHRQSPDSILLASSLSGMYETSEDSASQATSSIVSDEAAPILGRRAERERASASDSNSHSRLSDSDQSDDSDWMLYREQSCNSSNRTYDLTDIGKSLLSDIDYLVPSRLTAGDENNLIHYVQFDSTEGTLLAPSSQMQSLHMQHILNNFRDTSQLIHGLLQNTVRFKKLKAHEVSESLINKSLIAIKEHGMLFECPPLEGDGGKKNSALTYWVVGRLFFTPHPREVYVCYIDSAPQNLVEIAFRLALSASG